MSAFGGNDVTSDADITTNVHVAAADRSWLRDLLAKCTSLSQLQQLIKEKKVFAQWKEVREKLEQLKEFEVKFRYLLLL